MVNPELFQIKEEKIDAPEVLRREKLEKEADDFLSRSREEQLKGLGYEEIDEKQHKHAESLELSDEDYLRRRGVANRLDISHFDPRKNPHLSDEKKEKTRDEHDVHKIILEKIQKKDSKNSPEEQEKMLKALERAIAVDESIEELSGNPEAEQEMYALLRKRAVGTIDDAQMIEGVDEISHRYEFIPPATQPEGVATAKPEDDTVADVAKKEEIKTAVASTGVLEKNILGKSKNGDLLIQVEDALCGFNPGSLSINWVKININGHAYKFEGNSNSSFEPAQFQKEVGIARSRALFAYYELPFDGPQQEHLIELFLNQTGDVQEFRFQDLTTQVMTQMNQFFKDLKPTASRGSEDMKQSWRTLGILNDDDLLNRDRYLEIAKKWMEWKRVPNNQPFLETLE